MKTQLLAVAFAASLLVACSDGSSVAPATPQIATANATIVTTAANGSTIFSALAGQTFTFPNGVPNFGTTASTTLTVTNGGAGFSVSSGGETVTGVLTYGSCIFTSTTNVGSARFPILIPGQSIIVNPCTVSVNSAGQTVNTTQTRQVTVTLGSIGSTGSSVPVTVGSDGSIVVNGVNYGRVTVGNATGSSGT